MPDGRDPGTGPPETDVTAVLIVDDHKLFAEAVQLVLERDGFEVAVATTASEAMEAVRRFTPQVVLLDVGLPDRSGMELGKEILASTPGIKVVILTSLEEPRVLQEAVRLGLHGFLTKDTKLPQLVRAIRDVADGQLVVPHRLAVRRRNGEAEDVALLASQITPREHDVLELLARGANSADIASTLNVSPNTVRTHVQSILAKLQVHSRLEAVAFATMHNLVTTAPRSTTPRSAAPATH
jgi:DNA-binding NarL/FixJ family response regulator